MVTLETGRHGHLTRQLKQNHRHYEHVDKEVEQVTDDQDWRSKDCGRGVQLASLLGTRQIHHCEVEDPQGIRAEQACSKIIQ